MQSNWQKLFSHDRTAFVLLLIFFLVAMLGKYLIAGIFDSLLLIPLCNLGFLFMAGFLLASERRLRDKQPSSQSKSGLPWRGILLASAAVWVFGLFSDSLIFNLRSLLCWQFVFVGAVLIGYYGDGIERWWRQRLSSQTRQLSLAIVGVLTVLVLIFRSELIQANPSANWPIWLFDSVHVGPGLLLLFAAWLAMLYNIGRQIEATFSRQNWL